MALDVYSLSSLRCWWGLRGQWYSLEQNGVFPQAHQIQKRNFCKVLNVSYRGVMYVCGVGGGGEECPCLFEKDYWVIIVFEAGSKFGWNVLVFDLSQGAFSVKWSL